MQNKGNTAEKLMSWAAVPAPPAHRARSLNPGPAAAVWPTGSDQCSCHTSCPGVQLAWHRGPSAGSSSCLQAALLALHLAWGRGEVFSLAFLGSRRKDASLLVAVLALPARAEELSLKAGAALLQVEHTATMEHHNKQEPEAQESKGSTKASEGLKMQIKTSGVSCPCAQGPGKSPLHPHFGHLIPSSSAHGDPSTNCPGVMLESRRAPSAKHLAETPAQPAPWSGEQWGRSQRRLLGWGNTRVPR